MLKNRGAHLPVSEIPGDGEGGLLDMLPFVAFGRQHVLRAADGFGDEIHVPFSFPYLEYDSRPGREGRIAADGPAGSDERERAKQ